MWSVNKIVNNNNAINLYCAQKCKTNSQAHVNTTIKDTRKSESLEET